MARVVKGRVKEPVFRSPLITKVEECTWESEQSMKDKYPKLFE